MNFSRKIIIILVLFAFFCFSDYELKAQKGKKKKNTLEHFEEDNRETPAWREKVFFGGNFGLQIGTITSIEVSPVAGYRITDMFYSGVGITYDFYNNSFFDYSRHIFGGGIFARAYFFKGIFAHSDVFLFNVDDYNEFTPAGGSAGYKKEGRIWIPSFMVGGGYSQPLGERSEVYMMILWDLNETSDSPYENPIIKFGFYF